MAEPGRGLVRPAHQQTPTDRVVQQRRRPHRSNRHLGVTLERRPQTLRLDQDRQADHRQGQTRPSRPHPPDQIRDRPLATAEKCVDQRHREPEGECLYLIDGDDDDPNSSRDLVVWPAGTKWQADLVGVVLPNGDVALLGEVVEGGGGYHGPDYVLDLAGEEAAALAERCAGPWPRGSDLQLRSDVELID